MTKRKRGRPQGSGAAGKNLVTRERIIDLACDWAKERSLDEVTFVKLAKHFDVAPGALHYHIGPKDDLTSAIINSYYRDLVVELKQIDQGLPWRELLREFANVYLAFQNSHVGVAEYMTMNAKFRVFQKVREGETDYGAMYLDLVFSLLKGVGFDSRSTALAYHMISMYCRATAAFTRREFEPSVHEAFLKKRAASYPAGSMPGLEFALPAFAHINMDESFAFGLDALIEHFATLREGRD